MAVVEQEVLCVCVSRYDVTVMRNDSEWLVNSGAAQTLAVGNAAVMTVVIESNETNVSSVRFFVSAVLIAAVQFMYKKVINSFDVDLILKTATLSASGRL